jgi:hypothetical protein
MVDAYQSTCNRAGYSDVEGQARQCETRLDKKRPDCTVLVAGLCTLLHAHLLSYIHFLLLTLCLLRTILSSVLPEEQSVAEVCDSLRDTEAEARIEGPTLPSQC